MLDYTLEYTKIHIWGNNTSVINLTKNPIQHSRSKQINIKHHFVRDHAQKGNIEFKFTEIKVQMAYILTKPLIEDMFKFIKSLINVKCLTNLWLSMSFCVYILKSKLGCYYLMNLICLVYKALALFSDRKLKEEFDNN